MTKIIVNKPPKEQQTSPPEVSCSAQIAIENNNFSIVSTRLSSNLPVALINDSNIDICKQLYPESLNLPEPENKRRVTRTAKKSTKTPDHPQPNTEHPSSPAQIKRSRQQTWILRHLHQTGIITQRIPNAENTTTFIKPGILASFFSLVIQDNDRIATLQQTTYVVALRKIKVDPTKLRPIGIPSAVRRISAKVILHLFMTRLAKYLLPFNYAFGVNGGVDFIFSTIRLGVDKYITQKERQGLNCFQVTAVFGHQEYVRLNLQTKTDTNSGSRLPRDATICRHILRFRWTNYGQTWGWILGNHWCQGGLLARMSSVSNVYRHRFESHPAKTWQTAARMCLSMTQNWNQQLHSFRQWSRQHPAFMGYMDAVNTLASIQDALFVVEHFKRLEFPLGAILDWEKEECPPPP